MAKISPASTPTVRCYSLSPSFLFTAWGGSMRPFPFALPCIIFSPCHRHEFAFPAPPGFVHVAATRSYCRCCVPAPAGRTGHANTCRHVVILIRTQRFGDTGHARSHGHWYVGDWFVRVIHSARCEAAAGYQYVVERGGRRCLAGPDLCLADESDIVDRWSCY